MSGDLAYYLDSLLTPPSNFTLATTTRLKSRGVNLSREGVSIKTNKRWDRDDYLDATQRCVRPPSHVCPCSCCLLHSNSMTLPASFYRCSGFVKAYNNSTFGPGPGAGVRSHSASSIRSEHHNSEGRDRHGTVSGGESYLRKTPSSGAK